MFLGWFWNTIASIFSVVIAFAILAIVVSVLYVGINSCFLPKKRNKGRVISRTYTPALTEIDLLLSAGADLPYNQPYSTLFPAEYSVDVEVHGQRGCVSVSQKLFDELSGGNEVTVEYYWTRISDKFCPKKLFPI